MQRLVERVPGAAGLDGDRHVVAIDLKNPVHALHVDQHRVGPVGNITARVAHPAATRHQGQPARRGIANPGDEFVQRGRAKHRRWRCAAREDIVIKPRAQRGIAVNQAGAGVCIGHVRPFLRSDADYLSGQLSCLCRWLSSAHRACGV
jgi:hypothetical protein